MAADRWKPTAWSHSSVETMLGGCPYQLGLERIMGLPTWDHPKAAIGTAYHAAIEFHEQCRLAWRTGVPFGAPEGCSQEEMQSAARQALDRCNVRWTDKISPADAREQIDTAIEHWWSTPIPDGQPGAGGSLRDRIMRWEPVAIERRYGIHRLDVTARRISGIPDVVYTRGHDLTIVDHKSTYDFQRYPLDGNTVRTQAANYSRACVEAVNLPPIMRPADWPPVEVHIARTKSGKRADFEAARVVQVQPTDEDMRLVDQRMRLADQQAAAGNWNKNPDWFLCKPEWCPFHMDAGGPCDPNGPPEIDLTAFPQPAPVDGPR